MPIILTDIGLPAFSAKYSYRLTAYWMTNFIMQSDRMTTQSCIHQMAMAICEAAASIMLPIANRVYSTSSYSSSDLLYLVEVVEVAWWWRSAFAKSIFITLYGQSDIIKLSSFVGMLIGKLYSVISNHLTRPKTQSRIGLGEHRYWNSIVPE